MGGRRFFRLLWRFNAIVIAVIGILGTAFIVGAGYFALQEFFRPRYREDVVRLDPSVEKESFELSQFQRIGKSPYLSAELEKKQRGALFYGSGSKHSAAMRNLYVFDVSKGSGRWALPSNDWLVCHHYPTPHAAYSPEREKVTPRAFAFSIVKTDSNANRRLDCEDRQTLALARVNGEGYTEFATGLDRLSWSETHSDDPTVSALIEKDGAFRIIVIDLDKFAVTADKSIEMPSFAH